MVISGTITHLSQIFQQLDNHDSTIKIKIHKVNLEYIRLQATHPTSRLMKTSKSPTSALVQPRQKNQQIKSQPQFGFGDVGKIIKVTVNSKNSQTVQTLHKNLVFLQNKQNYVPGAVSVELGYNSSMDMNLKQQFDGNAFKPTVRQLDTSTFSSIHENDTRHISTVLDSEVNTSAFTLISEDK